MEKCIFFCFLHIFVRLEMRELLPVPLANSSSSLWWCFLLSVMAYIPYGGSLKILFLTNAYYPIAMTFKYCADVKKITCILWIGISIIASVLSLHPWGLSGLWNSWVFILPWLMLAPGYEPWESVWCQNVVSCIIQALLLQKLSLSWSKSLHFYFSFPTYNGCTVMVGSSLGYNFGTTQVLVSEHE